jgi:hypothetical protein
MNQQNPGYKSVTVIVEDNGVRTILHMAQTEGVHFETKYAEDAHFADILRPLPIEEVSLHMQKPVPNEEGKVYVVKTEPKRQGEYLSSWKVDYKLSEPLGLGEEYLIFDCDLCAEKVFPTELHNHAKLHGANTVMVNSTIR